MVEYMVTTIDNPFNYFTQFDDWYRFDVDHGYNTCAYLARIAAYSDEMSENDKIRVINDAVDEICKMNVLGIYRKQANPESKKEDTGPEMEETPGI